MTLNHWDVMLLNAAHDGNIEGQKKAIENGANINACNELGSTALIYAASRAGVLKSEDNSEWLSYLIANGADVNIADVNGETPLHWLVKKNAGRSVVLLIESGASLEAKNNRGHTPYALAFSQEDFDTAKYLFKMKRRQEEEEKIKSKTMLQGEGVKWDKILSEKIRENNLSGVKLCLENGADINIRNMIGETPLIRAAGDGYNELLEYLISQNADVTCVNEENENAAHVAAYGTCDGKTLDLLFNAGVCFSSKNKRGETPADISLEYNGGGYLTSKFLKCAQLQMHQKIHTRLQAQREKHPVRKLKRRPARK